MGGSSSTTRILTRGRAHAAAFPCSTGFGTGRVIVNTAPVRSVRFAAEIVPPQGLDEAARDGKPQPGAGAHLVALSRPVELVEDALEVGARNAVAFVEHLQLDAVLLLPALNADRRVSAARISRRCRAD